MKTVFFIKVLLLILLVNIGTMVVSASEQTSAIREQTSAIREQTSAIREQISAIRDGSMAAICGNLLLSVLGGIIGPVIHEYTKYLFVERPQIIIRSSKDKSEKLDKKMIFSDEVRLKLDNFLAIAKKTSEVKKVNSTVAYRNLLLHGPSGTGKTMVAEEMARELHRKYGMKWVLITGAGFFQNDAIKNVNSIFINVVKKNKKKGTVIIIDEADSLFNARENLRLDSDTYRVVNQLLSFMGTRTSDRIVIATTNHLILDRAMERRFDDAIKVPLPGRKERIETLRLYKDKFLLKNLTDEKIKKMAADTKGFSQSDLSGIVDKLKMKSDINGDTNIEEDADVIVREYCEKKQLFVQQEQGKGPDRLQELKSKRL